MGVKGSHCAPSDLECFSKLSISGLVGNAHSRGCVYMFHFHWLGVGVDTRFSCIFWQVMLMTFP